MSILRKFKFIYNSHLKKNYTYFTLNSLYHFFGHSTLNLDGIDMILDQIVGIITWMKT